MREPSRDKGRLSDIVEACSNVMEFTDGLTQEQFLSDKLRYFAVMKNIEIIGEASYMLSLAFKAEHREIPWDAIIKMRHILVHGYATVLPEFLWETAKTDIPRLKEQITAMVIGR